MSDLETYPDSVAALIAIARAASRAGDKRLARAARKLLREKHGVKLEKEAPPCRK